MAGKPSRKLRLGAFLMAPGHHVAAWQHPSSAADLGSNFRAYADIARKAESVGINTLLINIPARPLLAGTENHKRHCALASSHSGVRSEVRSID
jgi:hypothetical protein